jgi:phospholipid/cholesterol/gamma-HCH transport system ATP-binding protein
VSEVSDNLVRMSNVHFSRGDRKILDGINIDIPRGKVTTILGPSGTGKTTLLNLMGGQINPEQGEVWVDGENVPKLRRRDLFSLRKRMGMLFQSGALFSDLSVFDNVAFPLREHTDLSETMIRDIVLMKLESVGLRGARNYMPNELSGGMSRRVALARAVAMDPMMMMYDEPFTGQDPITVGVLMKLIRLMNDSLGLTSVIVSHDVQEVCAISDYLYLIAGGKVIAKGTPDELGRSDSEWVQQFMHGQPDGPAPFHFPADDFRSDLMGEGR